MAFKVHGKLDKLFYESKIWKELNYIQCLHYRSHIDAVWKHENQENVTVLLIIA